MNRWARAFPSSSATSSPATAVRLRRKSATSHAAIASSPGTIAAIRRRRYRAIPPPIRRTSWSTTCAACSTASRSPRQLRPRTVARRRAGDGRRHRPKRRRRDCAPCQHGAATPGTPDEGLERLAGLPGQRPRAVAAGRRAVAARRHDEAQARHRTGGRHRCPDDAAAGHGDQDTPAFESSVFVYRKARHAALAVLPGSGHDLPAEEPVLFNQLLGDFLGAVEGGRWGDWRR